MKRSTLFTAVPCCFFGLVGVAAAESSGPELRFQLTGPKSFQERIVVIKPVTDSTPSRMKASVSVIEARTGTQVQTLEDDETERLIASELTQEAVVQDANFDGYDDIILPTGSFNKGINYSVWIFDRKNNHYMYNATVSNLPNLSIDGSSKRVTSESGDIREYEVRYFEWRGAELLLVARNWRTTTEEVPPSVRAECPARKGVWVKIFDEELRAGTMITAGPRYDLLTCD